MDSQGSWHFKDGLSEVSNHHFRTGAELREIVEEYDGIDATICYDTRGSDWEKLLLLTLYYQDDKKDREHWAFDTLQSYLMTDSGKTIEHIR